MTGVIWSNDETWEQIQNHAREGGVAWSWVGSLEELREVIDRDAATIAVLDVSVIDGDVDRIVQNLTIRAPRCSVCVLLHQPFVDRAADLMRSGATDVSLSPVDEATYRRIVEADTVPRAGVEQPPIESTSVLEEARRALEDSELERAQKLVRRVLASEADNAQAFNLLGVVAEKQGELQLAQRYYRAAIDLEPEYQPARTNLERATTHDDRRPPVLGDPKATDEQEA